MSELKDGSSSDFSGKCKVRCSSRGGRGKDHLAVGVPREGDWRCRTNDFPAVVRAMFRLTAFAPKARRTEMQGKAT